MKKKTTKKNNFPKAQSLSKLDDSAVGSQLSDQLKAAFEARSLSNFCWDVASLSWVIVSEFMYSRIWALVELSNVWQSASASVCFLCGGVTEEMTALFPFFCQG